MTLRMSSGEVSEVIFRMLNRAASLTLQPQCGEFDALRVCYSTMLLRISVATSTTRIPIENCSKPKQANSLDTLCLQHVVARLARLGEVMVLSITSPSKPMKTLEVHAKARLARLFLPMLTCTHARAHTRVINIFAYRSGLKITSLNLANLAGRFSSASERPPHACNLRTTMPTVACILPSRPLRRYSHSSRQSANSRHTERLPLWHATHSICHQRMVPPPKNQQK